MSTEKLERRQGIYVDLDSLLDTRLSTLFLIHDSLVGLALNNNYLTRYEDSFKQLNPVLTKEKFKEVYDTRDNEVIQNSSYTKVLSVIRDSVRKLVHQKLETPYTTDISLYINTFPFTLNQEEEQAVAKSLIHYTDGECQIEFINLSIEELTPKYCSDNFSLMIKYEYGDWLDFHSKNEAIRKIPLTTLTLIVPEIFFARMPNSQELNEIRNGKFDPFGNMEVIFAPIIGLKTMPASVFSIDLDTKWKFMHSKRDVEKKVTS